MLQQPIAAVASASASNRKRWVAIHSIINRRIAVKPPYPYCVNDTEFDTALLEENRDAGDENLAIINQAEYYAADIAELYVLLANLKVDPESFNAPWHVDHPLL